MGLVLLVIPALVGCSADHTATGPSPTASSGPTGPSSTASSGPSSPSPTASSGTTGQSATASSGPSDPEVVATIKSLFTEVYGVDSGGAQFGSVDISVDNITHGQPTAMNLQIGGPGILVYPVKAQVEIDVHYSNNPTVQHSTRGVMSDDVFKFYKDAFGNWTFKTGSL